MWRRREEKHKLLSEENKSFILGFEFGSEGSFTFPEVYEKLKRNYWKTNTSGREGGFLTLKRR